uniref:Transmembrane protein n=1 Tax=Rhizophora mucronata TaxID=61149 RepID=A0A2P2L8S2_RHIMU
MIRREQEKKTLEDCESWRFGESWRLEVRFKTYSFVFAFVSPFFFLSSVQERENSLLLSSVARWLLFCCISFRFRFSIFFLKTLFFFFKVQTHR